jgi:two-component system response regulator YesN
MTRLEHLFYRIIEAHKERSACAELTCAVTTLRILSELDQTVRQRLSGKRDKYVAYYVNKAESILLRRYAEKLTVKSVAEELSVSPNYLSAIFKASTGVGFTDRLLELRMKKAASLLREGTVPESEIGGLVGYEEQGHFRRRFKQYFGVGIRDYRLIDRELTLYHDKPQKRES